jgi:transketolase
MDNTDLYKRIIDISFRHKLSHLGSCLSAVDIIEYIYSLKKEQDKFILSSGHAALALYVVNEKHYGIDAEQALKHHGIHPETCEKCKIDCTSGSLGHGLPIAVGMALSNPDKIYWCLVSDGECAEGSVWESLNIIQENKIMNLMVFININGFGAYRKINKQLLKSCLLAHIPDVCHNFVFWDRWDKTVGNFPFLKNDLSDHYSVLTQEEYDAFALHL